MYGTTYLKHRSHFSQTQRNSSIHFVFSMQNKLSCSLDVADLSKLQVLLLVTIGLLISIATRLVHLSRLHSRDMEITARSSGKEGQGTLRCCPINVTPQPRARDPHYCIITLDYVISALWITTFMILLLSTSVSHEEL